MLLHTVLTGVSGKTCRHKKKSHVYRFSRYVGPWDMSLPPWDPNRRPKLGVFKCTECESEVVCKIKHRP